MLKNTKRSPKQQKHNKKQSTPNEEKTKTYIIVSLFASISEESTTFYPIFRLACYKAFLNYIPYGRNFALFFFSLDLS